MYRTQKKSYYCERYWLFRIQMRFLWILYMLLILFLTYTTRTTGFPRKTVSDNSGNWRISEKNLRKILLTLLYSIRLSYSLL